MFINRTPKTPPYLYEETTKNNRKVLQYENRKSPDKLTKHKDFLDSG